MKKRFPLMAIVLALCAGLLASVQTAQAAQSAAQMAQQSKMSACSKEGKGKKGAEHKAFMQQCLGNKTAATETADGAAQTPAAAASGASGVKATAQTSKMKTCNQEASGKTGAERKAFMKECLHK